MSFAVRRRPVPAREDRVFRILTVCTGNICRSPQAEQLLRVRVPQAFGREEIAALHVSSAGTAPSEGAPMDRWAIDEAVRLGITDTDHHRALRLDRSMLLEADLVLGMTREHRRVASGRRGAPPERAFTLVEFRLVVEALAKRGSAAGVPPLGEDGFAAFMRRLVAAAAAARDSVRMPKPELLLDIIDPYRFDADVYRRSADAIDRNVTQLATAIATLARGETAPPQDDDLVDVDTLTPSQSRGLIRALADLREQRESRREH
ncbi:hypothetical protein [Agrococcus sp. TF02-05]|uniref:arsenate reductase/protein-tyrosine-phosphatase family protein n=1 Tax=Agrococcus sp. TF02-05 TaxID=2815211 RepID=UPI001AA163C7|nr:hypothetical protein [Agrococcus sp. TF02-05]MBO1769505.1 hypothetical protein [Agrococcus sp. TF02-05]